jgi:hypothetical protein
MAHQRQLESENPSWPEPPAAVNLVADSPPLRAFVGSRLNLD